MVEKSNYKIILSEKQYIKLLLANFVNRFGDAIDTIAYLWLVYSVTGQAAWTAIIYAFNKIPTVLLQPFVGVWVERMNKKKVMVIVDLFRGMLVLLLVLFIQNTMVTKTILVIFTLATSIAETFRLPSSMAFLPSVLKKSNYKYGVSLNSSIVTVSELIGLSISGIIIDNLGVNVCILIDAITFYISAFLIYCIKLDNEDKEDFNNKQEKYSVRLKEGLLYIKKKRVILNFCIMAVMINALLVPLNSLLIPFVKEELHSGSNLISIINAGLLIGMMLGSFIMPYITKNQSPNKTILIYGEVIGISYVALALSGMIHKSIVICIMSTIVSLLFGTAVSIINTILRIQFMNCVEKEYLSRAGAIFNAGGSGITPLVSWIVGLIVIFMNVSSIYLICGVFCILFFIFIKIIKLNFAE